MLRIEHGGESGGRPPGHGCRASGRHFRRPLRRSGGGAASGRLVDAAAFEKLLRRPLRRSGAGAASGGLVSGAAFGPFLRPARAGAALGELSALVGGVGGDEMLSRASAGGGGAASGGLVRLWCGADVFGRLLRRPLRRSGGGSALCGLVGGGADV
ncbi:hypothetical protein M885DRAFT_188161 [Pelagophyceae sp. CCMP2097]|nr:hypothetical protein M885DRAFT_188161 [Pelagophyceae sp. CCMP2097]